MALKPIKFSELEQLEQVGGAEIIPIVKQNDEGDYDNYYLTPTQIAELAEQQAGTGDKSFEQDFADLSLLEITHNLGKRPSITVIDSAGDEVEGDYSYPDFNNVSISFSAPFSGKVILN